MDTRRATGYGFSPSITLNEGIAETMTWYRERKDTVGERYNAFTEDRLKPNG
jgi:dTDP-D-glucose 4,6-dehydratase